MMVNEIFAAPQGEGVWAGMPMVFVRLQGCNLRCEFCDTTQAIGRKVVDPSTQEWDPAGLADRLRVEYGDGRVVCFTGGEPLIQIDEVAETAEELHKHGWVVHIETNGTIKPMPEQAKHFDWITVSPKGPRWTLAVPGEYVKEVKFVVPPEDEFCMDLSSRIWAGHEIAHAAAGMCPDAFLWFQPRNNEPKAVEWCLKLINAYQAIYHPTPLTVGLSVQVHKFIGSR